jgi:hypothetical protein
MAFIKVSELSGVALDYAVALCEGLPLKFDPMGFKSGTVSGPWVWDERKGFNKAVYQRIGGEYSPSTNGSQGGQLIEDHKIISQIDRAHSMREPWRCALSINPYDLYSGETNLQAAMRCYVASVKGESIEIPDKLLRAA